MWVWMDYDLPVKKVFVCNPNGMKKSQQRGW